MLRVLLVDHHDSFTGNLVHLVAAAHGAAPTVIRHDEEGWDAARIEREFDAVILSPGPGTPEHPADLGVSAELLSQSRMPILGVCLGHQAIGLAAGGAIVRAPVPVHGRVAAIAHEGSGVFAGLPSPFAATRYHSLLVKELPPALEPTAWTSDGLLMGLRHRELPRWGVQFHPESIASEHGVELLRGFLRLAAEAIGADASTETPETTRPPAQEAPPLADASSAAPPTTRRLALRTATTPLAASAAAIFRARFGEEPHALWLDGGAPGRDGARRSIMGAPTGPHAQIVRASVTTGEVRLERPGAATEIVRSGLFDWLDAELATIRLERGPGAPDTPFALGYAGWLGYELKAETIGVAVHASPLPDALLMLLDRAIVVDHDAGAVRLLALADPDDADDERAAAAWLERTALELAELRDDAEPDAWTPPRATLRARHPEAAYLDRIAACRGLIEAGESYELCLTNELIAELGEEDAEALDPLAMYLALRAEHPAAYGAFIRAPEACVLSSSPERFLAIDTERRVESRPFKGTRPRGETPPEDQAIAAELAASEKDRAENLMIVDLVRHDLSRTAALGSVEVPELFAVERHPSVHQLVSTVTSRLAPGRTAVEAIRDAFPAGSMTGAPKERTMALLDALEAGPRGVYSGAIGWLSLDGAAELAVVIRTIVARGRERSYGVGGAIVWQSEADAEVEETIVKATPLLRLLGAEFPRGEGA